jgi:hypothetical protein
MGCLHVVQAFNLLLALEVAGGIRECLEAVEKIAETGFEVRLHLRAAASQQIAQFRVEASESQSLTQATCLVPSRLVCWRFLHLIRPQSSFSRHG